MYIIYSSTYVHILTPGRQTCFCPFSRTHKRFSLLSLSRISITRAALSAGHRGRAEAARAPGPRATGHRSYGRQLDARRTRAAAVGETLGRPAARRSCECHTDGRAPVGAGIVRLLCVRHQRIGCVYISIYFVTSCVSAIWRHHGKCRCVVVGMSYICSRDGGGRRIEGVLCRQTSLGWLCRSFC